MIDYTLSRDGRVLMALPTAQLASRMRQRFADKIDIDTCAASFGLMEDVSAAGMPVLSIYTLIVIDEISQLQG